MRRALFRLPFLVMLLLVFPVAAAAPQSEPSLFERDRRAILAMAGDYDVGFDFRETVAVASGYKPIGPTKSGGHEVVRVVEDRGRFISLQHLLVGQMGGQSMVIKHWRQDWTYEPASVLVYDGQSRWVTRQVPADERRGAWAQTVWQTDDSPRYGGVGRWTHSFGQSGWTSGPTIRPLPRRDAIRKPPYDRYEAVNRHILTPTGWVHLQDNVKIGPRQGALQAIVHEDAINTYDHFHGFNIKAAEDYWARSGAYWAAVRQAWDEAIGADGRVAVAEEADMGSVTSPELMGLADEVAEGRLTTDRAVERARRVIAQHAK